MFFFLRVDCLKIMSGRIKEMRLALHAKLKANGTPGSWNHVVDQIGMFTFTGLERKMGLEGHSLGVLHPRRGRTFIVDFRS